MARGLRGCFSGVSLIRRSLLLVVVVLSTCLLMLVRQYVRTPVHVSIAGNHMRTPLLPGAGLTEISATEPEKKVESPDNQADNGYTPVPWSDRTVTDPAVLVIFKKRANPTLRQVRRLLEAQRIRHRFYMLSAFRTPILVRLAASSPFPVGRYTVIVVVDVMDFVLEESVWMLVTDYCRSYRAGMVLVAAGLTKTYSAVLSWHSPTGVVMSVVYPQEMQVHHMRMCAPTGVFKIIKDGGKWTNIRNDSLFIVFKPPPQPHQYFPQPNFEPIVRLSYMHTKKGVARLKQQPVALLEHGKNDGVEKVYIGSPLSMALSRLVLLDALRHLSRHSPVLRYPLLDRWILVDIDDTFVAPRGHKMRTVDVQVGVDPAGAVLIA